MCFGFGGLVNLLAPLEVPALDATIMNPPPWRGPFVLITRRKGSAEGGSGSLPGASEGRRGISPRSLRSYSRPDVLALMVGQRIRGRLSDDQCSEAR